MLVHSLERALSDGFSLALELRASNRVANTQPELSTNSTKIVNKQNHKKKGVSDLLS